MVSRLKAFAIATVAAVTLGAAVAATTKPVQAFSRSPRHYGHFYRPGVRYNVVGNVIAAGSYPYYADPYGSRRGSPYQYPYPGYGFYYGY